MALAKITDPLARYGLILACLALIGIMMVIVIDVLSRNLFAQPVRGAYDLVSILLLIMIFSGMASVVAERAEILLDLVDGALPRAAVRGLKVVASLTTLGICLYLLYAMISPAQDSYRYGEQSLELGLPFWILWVFALAGLVVVSAVALARALQDMTGGDSDMRAGE
ncbi:TRAP transporter small permease [Alphaproteobacteria bacterium KMM 3653]|uniref:TRAP transporter small permease protein n=1 Tax=Harenicola maris TaxID=2841044 RepID=A0AAP2G313_9RHOB|nr:TRAP transporter small permease [Harenicola maris]